MNYKIEGAIRRNRKYFIVFILLWIALQLFGVGPFVYSKYTATQNNELELGIFCSTFARVIYNPFIVLKGIFEFGIQEDFFSAMLGSSVIFIIAYIIGIVRSKPKNEYTDIEHGSSDWSQRGEQYKILSKNEGLILGENNYLPLNKMGNINVLVVGRIWIR